MSRSHAVLLAALACVLAVPPGCTTSAEPQSGADTRTQQDRDRINDGPGGANRGGGGY